MKIRNDEDRKMINETTKGYFLINIEELNENYRKEISKQMRDLRENMEDIIIRIIINENNYRYIKKIVKFVNSIGIHKIIFKFDKTYSGGRLVKLKYYQANSIPLIYRIIKHNTKTKFFFENMNIEYFKDILNILPVYAHIEPTNICTLKCPLCPVGQGVVKPKKNMSFENFKKIIDEIPTLRHIRLWNLGEPLMNKDIFKMIEYAKLKNVGEVVLSTNAMFLTKDICKKIIDSGLDYILISLDGATEKTYSKYRVDGDFKTVLKNIRQLVKMKNKAKAELTINIQFIVMRHNEHEITKMKALAVNLGVDRVSFKTVSIDSNESRFLPKNEELRRFQKYHNNYFEQINTYLWCPMPWEHVTILCDGTVTLCCKTNFHDNRCTMGNIFNESFDRIWNNEKYQKVRRIFLENLKKPTNRLLEECRSCYLGGRNRLYL